MKRKFSFRKTFNATAAALALSVTSSFDAAAMPTTPAATAEEFKPFSLTGEFCPVTDLAKPEYERHSFSFSAREQQRLLSSLGFSIGRNVPDGNFTERTIQSVNEFRLLYYGDVPFSQSLSAAEAADLKAFAERALRERSSYKMTLENATALRFASKRTDAIHGNLVKATNGGRRDLQTTTSGWLYLVKTQGHKYGLGYFADKITLEMRDGQPHLSVMDAATYRQIMALGNHANVATVMQAEVIRDASILPATFYASLQEPVPNLLRVQQNLITLGFDVGGADGLQGPSTEMALQKFSVLYGPLLPAGSDALDHLDRFAAQARQDAGDYGISTAAAAAIRLASLRTGADFGYMMELSSAESSFDPDAKAGSSSATGLYQFTEDTWLQTINRYGAQYGMGDLADQISSTHDMYGTLVARVENPFVRISALDLRRDPHFAAVMAAEFQMRNKFLIECGVGHALNRTEQYLGHFLGSDGAISFINNMANDPDAKAAEIFPRAAGSNRSIFYKRNSKGQRVARSLREVYEIFDRKFDSAVYEDKGVISTLPLKKPPSP